MAARTLLAMRRLGAALLLVTVTACGSEGSTGLDDSLETDAGQPDPSGTSDGGDTSGETGSMDDETGDAPVDAAGRCDYTNLFSQGAECRDYVGAGWTDEGIQSDCDDQMGTTTLGASCSNDGVIGRCILEGGTDLEVQIVFYGDDAEACGLSQTGCETFGGGTFEPEGVCADEDPTDTGGGGVANPFIQPTLECRDPVDGEAPGDGPNGQICTWQLISAATEEGRHYEDYADCNVVYSQRPYYPVAGNDLTEDDRMGDPVYTAELDWVREQIEATACVCCHSDVAPGGSSNWTIDAPGNWIGTFDDTGLAFSAGWIDSTSFGSFPPEENNGFDRRYGVPSTDPERMRAFFLDELEHRGLTEDDFADDPAFGGPLYTQLIYEPSACEKGERVDRDGTIHWDGGAARYVYVLEAGSGNPTVPPNLDLPDGTMWRVDVPWDEETVIDSGAIEYGDTPGFAGQRFPEAGAPTDLIEGEEYYLYVLADVAIPLTRCLFTY